MNCCLCGPCDISVGLNSCREVSRRIAVVVVVPFWMDHHDKLNSHRVIGMHQRSVISWGLCWKKYTSSLKLTFIGSTKLYRIYMLKYWSYLKVNFFERKHKYHRQMVKVFNKELKVGHIFQISNFTNILEEEWGTFCYGCSM